MAEKIPLSKIQFSLLIAKIVGFTFWLEIRAIQTNARLNNNFNILTWEFSAQLRQFVKLSNNDIGLGSGVFQK